VTTANANSSGIGFIHLRLLRSTPFLTTGSKGLVAQGSLGSPVGYQPGLSKLITAADVQSFADRYVAATILAKRFNLNGKLFSRYLKESGTPMFAVPISEKGRGRALFVPKAIAVSARIPCP
jgi:hypothetical protein